jgi:hypothetical protein
MPTSPSGISFEELENSPKLHIGESGQTATRRFRVAWVDYGTFVNDLLGLQQVYGNTATAGNPMAFPGDSSGTLIATDVDIEPFDGGNPSGTITNLDTGINAYTGGALIVVNYKQVMTSDQMPFPNPPTIPEGTFLSYEAELGCDVETVEGLSWKWVDLGETLAPEQGSVRLIPTGTHHMTWHRIPRPPWTAMANCRGKVNNASFMGFEDEILLFLGPKATFQFNTNGTVIYDFQYTFQSKDQTGNGQAGWNFYWNKHSTTGAHTTSDGHWQAITSVEASANPYATADFSTLFRFE